LSNGTHAAVANMAIEHLGLSVLWHNLATTALLMKENLLSEISLFYFLTCWSLSCSSFLVNFQHCDSSNQDFMFQQILFTSTAIQAEKIFPF